MGQRPMATPLARRRVRQNKQKALLRGHLLGGRPLQIGRANLQERAIRLTSWRKAGKIGFMNPRSISRLFLPIILALGLCSIPAYAGSKPRPTPVHHHVTIESISADSITINAPDGVKTYKISPNTEISFKGETATVDQLQAGMRVQVTPDAADDTIAGEIQANDPPHDPTPKPKK